MKYNYVIFGSDWDLYRFAYSDLYELDNVRYIPGMRAGFSSFKKYFFKFHFTPKINKYINLPFKEKWASSFYKDSFKDKKPICFLFFSNWVQYENLYLIEYLREKYINSKFVWFLQDLFDLQRTYSHNKPINIEAKKKSFDLIISFDSGDCERYGFVYHPLVFSSFKGKVENMVESDVYFLGQAKNRFSKIISVYEKLRSSGLKCDFYIVGVDKKEQVYTDEIKYNQRLDYAQNLQHVIHSKCLLEVMQKNGYGYTQRVVEILGLNKKLLTNNPIIKDAPFYNPEYISTFNSPDEIDINFLNHIKDNKLIDYKYKEKISPKEFLYFIENNLS